MTTNVRESDITKISFLFSFRITILNKAQKFCKPQNKKSLALRSNETKPIYYRSINSKIAWLELTNEYCITKVKKFEDVKYIRKTVEKSEAKKIYLFFNWFKK